MSYEEYRRWIVHIFPNVWKGPTLDLMAGSLSGGTAVIFTYPLDLIRTKLAYQVNYIFDPGSGAVCCLSIKCERYYIWK